MSCRQPGRRISQTAGVSSGLPALSEPVSDTTGRLLTAATRFTDRLGQVPAPAATAALRIVEPTGPRAARQRRWAGRLARGAVTVGAYASGLGPLLRPVKLAARLADVVTSKLGTLAAGLSETAQAGQVTTPRRVLFFKTKQVVPLRRSALTGWLNRQALIGQRPVTRNEGVLFTLKGKTWHHGTVTFNVDGQPRTVSHLQSLSYPGRHYYFDRPLSRPQAVAVARGRTKPESLPGYAGQLSRTDMLCPAWAGVKRALILTHLHWPEGQG